MTIKYDPNEGTFWVSARFRGTVVSQVLARPDFYIIFCMHCLLSVARHMGVIHHTSHNLDLSLGMTVVTGSLLTFFVVFYNQAVYTRYMRLYELTRNMNEYCLYVTSILCREIQNVDFRRKLTRLLLASSFVFFFQRTPNGKNQKACSISAAEWSKLQSLGLLEQEEKELLQEHCRQAGSAACPSFLLLQWSIRMYRTQSKRINELELAYWSIRRCQDDVVEIMELPIPFQYFHLMNLLLFLNLLLWAYSIALLKTPLATLIFLFIQLTFQGIRELSIALADPYGDDAVDFPLNDWINSLWVRVSLIVEDAWLEEDSYNDEEVEPMIKPQHGERIINLWTDLDTASGRPRARLQIRDQREPPQEGMLPTDVRDVAPPFWALDEPQGYERLPWGYGGGRDGIALRSIATVTPLAWSWNFPGPRELQQRGALRPRSGL